MFRAVLDSCVLWPSRQRDFLLSLAAVGLYVPVWSAELLNEIERNEAEKLLSRGATTTEAVDRSRWLIDQMTEFFPDSAVTGYRPLIGGFGLRDPNDEHVVAAAVVGGAGTIVTENRRDIEVSKLPEAMTVLSAADFAARVVAVSPGRALQAIRELTGRYRSGPRMSPAEFIALLDITYGMGEVADLLFDLADDG